jgi:hypothetical protein
MIYNGDVGGRSLRQACSRVGARYYYAWSNGDEFAGILLTFLFEAASACHRIVEH